MRLNSLMVGNCAFDFENFFDVVFPMLLSFEWRVIRELAHIYKYFFELSLLLMGL